MPAFRYVFNMEPHRPALLVSVFSRGAIVDGGPQTAVNTVTVHAPHDIQIGDKFLYALTRSNIKTERIFTVSGIATDSVTFDGDPFTFVDKCHLVGIGVDSGGIEQDDGTFSKLNWDGSTIDVAKSPDMADLYSNSEIAVEPGGEVGFWAEATDLWCIARATGGAPLRIYIFSVVDADPQAVEAAVPSPTETVINDAYAWYRADSITDLANGANMTSWPDSSGHARDLTAAGITAGTVADSVRPKWNEAGSANATPNLPVVTLQGATGGPWGYFSINQGTIPLTIANGWTIGFILRDYGLPFDFGQGNLFGHGAGDSDDDYIGVIGRGSNVSRMLTEEGASAKDFSNNYVHTDGGDTEVVVLRCAATSGTLRAWVDGSLIPSTGNGGNPYTRTTNLALRYIGRRTVGASTTGTQALGFAEIVIFDRALSDSEVATLQSYLIGRLATAGSSALLSGGIPRNIGTWNVNAATDGTNTPCTNGTAYVGSIFVPTNMPVTGIQYLVGATGGTNNVIASLHDAAGAVVARSASTLVGTAAQLQQLPFTAVTPVTGPAWYFIALTFNGATATFRTVPAFCNVGNGVIGNGVAQTFGTVAAFTPPTTFTADKVPVASLY